MVWLSLVKETIGFISVELKAELNLTILNYLINLNGWKNVFNIMMVV